VLAVRTRVLLAGSLYGDDSRALVMPSSESIDVDDASDLDLLEMVLAKKVVMP
jgi:CMP-N-acetylneuraminic acid synthetase